MFVSVKVVSLGGLIESFWLRVPSEFSHDLNSRDVILGFVPGDINLVVAEVQKMETTAPKRAKVGRLVTKLDRLDAINLGSLVAEQVAQLLVERKL
ncbi:hypothetical protein FXE12_11980 [Lactobacillus sp. SL9-6]|nr:hypothetical protein FXE12_11980 [Lactobacillus sp. SL9-6]